MRRTGLAATALFALILPAAGCAPAPAGPGVVVSKAWSRPASAGGVGGGFAEIRNTGPGPVTVVSVATPAAERAELHQSVETAGVWSMKDFPDGIVIPAHGKLELAPGGYHLMLVGMKARTLEGQTIPAALTVRRAGKVETVSLAFAVRNTAP